MSSKIGIFTTEKSTMPIPLVEFLDRALAQGYPQGTYYKISDNFRIAVIGKNLILMHLDEDTRIYQLCDPIPPVFRKISLN